MILFSFSACCRDRPFDSQKICDFMKGSSTDLSMTNYLVSFFETLMSSLKTVG